MAYTPFKFPKRTAPNQKFPMTPGYFGQLNMPVTTGPATGYNPRGMLPLATPNANATPKNQKAAIIMGALSDIFRGQDPTQNTIARQQQFMVQQERDRQLAEQENIRQAIINDPRIAQSQKEIVAAFPELYAQSLLTKPNEIKPPTSYQEYALTDPTPTNQEYSVFLKNKTSQGATQINLPNLEAQSNITYAYKVLEQGDQRLIENQSVTDRLYVMDTILDNPEFKTGAKEEALLPIRSWLVEFGGKDENYVNTLGEQQLFDALSSYIVPRMRAVGSGATSDFEAKLYQSAIASLGKTPEANRMIIKFMLATTERDRKLLELQKKYVAENREILGFNAALNDPNSGYVEPELFRKFDMKEENGITDLQQAVANGDIKEGDLYYDRKVKKMRIYGSEPIPDPF